jgi:hypothetical protein
MELNKRLTKVILPCLNITSTERAEKAVEEIRV